MSAPRLVLVLSENWTLTPPRDLRALVEMAVIAEEAGFDAVMVSEHIVLGPAAGANGIMGNPRDYALPGNQDPAMPWPSSLVLLSAIAAATTRLRLAACAVIAPLRHPLLLARELGTLDLLSEGRLVVQPTVSWHRDEYAALGVPFGSRGALLDEHLDGLGGTLAGLSGIVRRRALRLRQRLPRAEGLASGRSTAVARRRVASTLACSAGSSAMRHGFHPLGQPTDADLLLLRDGLAAAGRDIAELELVGGMRAVFPDDDSVVAARPRDRVDPGAAGTWFHDLLHQAVPVRRRARRSTRPGAARSSSG